ncbi:MAG: tRNA (adenosine(37)-N6)-dimethylallyltransferase MiaA, partial [Proteobacteria bacterium]|nr:tRNA (adenosine(37)-N6)-dimethylallyltransferase MiaA [Pseudomonadota bacterium]
MASTKQPPVIVIAGPTASGKSRLALMIAGRMDATLINADSMQVYRELRVLTARPSKDDEGKAPHALYGVMSAADACSAGYWSRQAETAINAARAVNRIPILVGGTGLYLKAATVGLDDIPDVPDDVRQRVRGLHEELGMEAFFDLLRSKDPMIAGRLSPTDPQRAIRALEVLEATGRS